MASASASASARQVAVGAGKTVHEIEDSEMSREERMLSPLVSPSESPNPSPTASPTTLPSRPKTMKRPGSARPVLRRLPSRDEAQKAFCWLGWSPMPGSAVAEAMERCFPGTLPGSALVARTSAVLGTKDITPENTIFGSSICADEINMEPGDMADQYAKLFGEVFNMGGISGAPFVGKTGFSAFSHHVPDNGNVLILFGPHVGITSDGTIGKYLRHGQHELSSACGAVSAAFAQCCAGQCGPDFADPNDMQQTWLRDQLAPYCQEIQEASEPQMELVYRFYNVIKESIEAIVNNDFGSGKLVLIGGIQINLQEPNEDHFLPLTFEIRQKGKATIDLLDGLRL
uniref:Limiting CO2-inducible protein B/C beta carbonyic anhydrase domain-containing protein n=1 Tax=Phaeomonas parva TaxID=124430 RepID=A0A7S1TQ14_9STRA